MEQVTRRSAGEGPARARAPRLTHREREILALLAGGLSGSQIAERLVLSPDTVRTHVRNAMTKLHASTRSQAVALALESGEIGPRARRPAVAPQHQAPRVSGGRTRLGAALQPAIERLVELWDVERGAIYLAAEEGMLLRRVALSGSPNGLPGTLALAEGPLGRAVLERRARVVPDRLAGGVRIAAPILNGGRVLGVVALVPRSSRAVGQSELLLLSAFAARIGAILAEGGDAEPKLSQAAERFRASWIAATAER